MSGPSLILPAHNLETHRPADARLANVDPDTTVRSLSDDLHLSHPVEGLSYTADHIISKRLNTLVTNDLRAPTKHEVKLLEKVIHEALHPQLIPKGGQRATFANLEVSTYESEYIPPLQPEWSIQVIQSPMGTDKTGKLCQYIKDTQAPSATFTSPRRTFTRSCTARFRQQGIAVKSYLEGNISEKDDFVIISAESLRQLKTVCRILAVDEGTAMMRQMNSGLHKDALSDNQQMLITFIRNSPRIIFMDAHIDPRVLILIHLLRPDELIHYQINTIKKRKDWVAYPLDEITMYNQLSHDLKQGKNVEIICGSEKYAEQYIEPIVKAAVGDDKYRFYHSKGRRVEAGELDHVDSTWSKLRVLMFTSTITQGINYTSRHFNSAYVFGHSQSNTVDEIGQMMGRVRDLVNTPDEEHEPKKIYFWNQTRKERLPDTHEAIKKQIEGHLDLGSLDLIKYLGPYSRELGVRGSKICWQLKDNYWTWLSIQNQLERNLSRNNYDKMFVDMLSSQGITIGKVEYVDNSDNIEYTDTNRYYLKEQEDQVQEFKEWKKLQSRNWKQSQILDLSNATWLVNFKQIQQYRSIRENGQATRDQLITLRKTELLHYIDPKNRDIVASDGKTLSILSDNLPQLLNCQMVRDWAGQDVALRDLKSHNYQPSIIPELHLPQFEGITWLCQVIGVKSVLDRETVVWSETIRQRAELVIQSVLLLDLRFRIPHLEVRDYSGVLRYINARLRTWSGCFLKQIGRRKITLNGKKIDTKYYQIKAVDGIDEVLSLMTTKRKFVLGESFDNRQNESAIWSHLESNSGLRENV